VNKLPISVCIISGAEAQRVARALESIQGWTGEIIMVLNEDVHDGTEEIARQYGATIFREPWKGHIAQKNSAAEKATQEWLLGLDADEVVSPGLRDEIIAALEHEAQAPQHEAFSFPRLSYYCGRWIRHGDWYPDRKTRLWRRGKARWGGENPHDKLMVDGRVGRLRHDLLHYSYDSISSFLNKINQYADISLKQQIHSGKKWSTGGTVVRSGWRFLRAYFFRLGFLDGFPGFFIAASNAYSTLVRHSRLYEHLHAEAPSAPAQDSPVTTPPAKATESR